MKPFKYLEPKDIEEACTLLSKHKNEAKIIAGGQSLLALLKNRLIAPQHVISIKGLHDLDYIKEGPNTIRVGAVTTHRAIETSPLVKKRFSILPEMEHQLGSVHVRNWGTVGGALCGADPAGDLAPCLIALGAKVKVESAGGRREIALSEFFLDYLETVLQADEILAEVEIPYPAPHSGWAFVKESLTVGAMATVSVAVVVTLDKKIVKDARIVLGAVGSTPLRAKEAEKVLVGEEVGGDLGKMAALAAAEARPTTDVRGSVEYKRELVKVLTKSAVRQAVDRAL